MSKPRGVEWLENETGEVLERRLLGDGIARDHNPDREAIDSAIAALEEGRRRLRPPAA